MNQEPSSPPSRPRRSNFRRWWLMLILLVAIGIVHSQEESAVPSKKKKKPRSREKQTWTVAATTPLGIASSGSSFVHWVCFAKEEDVENGDLHRNLTEHHHHNMSSMRGEKMSCCQEIYRLMNHESQLCYQYVDGGDCSDEGSRAPFLRMCSQTMALVPSYPRYFFRNSPASNNETEKVQDSVTLTPAKWSLVVANAGAAQVFQPIEFWRQCISFSVSAGHWYYTVASPFRLATETPSEFSDSTNDPNTLSTNVTCILNKKRTIDYSLSFQTPSSNESTAPALLKGSLTLVVTIPEAVGIVMDKSGHEAIRCVSSSLTCTVETIITGHSTTTKKTKKSSSSLLNQQPQNVVAIVVEINGTASDDRMVAALHLSIPLQLMDDEVPVKVISPPSLEASHVEIGKRSFTLRLNRKQRLGTPLVLLDDDNDDGEL